MTKLRSITMASVLAVACTVTGVPDAEAIPIEISYEGVIDVSGLNSSALFRDRPETTISGSFSYDSDTIGTPDSVGTLRFPLTDYGFTIAFPDRPDYVSTGINTFTGTNLSLVAMGPIGGPQIDMAVGGIFDGGDMTFGFRPSGSNLIISDGLFNSSTSTMIPADFFERNALPDTAFTLDDLSLGRGFMSLEWTNSLGGRQLARFDLTSVSGAPLEEVPDDDPDDPVKVSEPGTLALFGIGLFGMGLARRRKKA